MSNEAADAFDPKIAVLLIGVGSTALVLTIYRRVTMGWCDRNRAGDNPPQPRQLAAESTDTPGSVENSAARLIPAYEFRRGTGLACGDGETCAICLSEFEEGEELRTLPECMHTYHVPCIDMWLYSHSNCPMCRAEATPASRASGHVIDLGLYESQVAHQNLGMLQAVNVNSRRI